MEIPAPSCFSSPLQEVVLAGPSTPGVRAGGSQLPRQLCHWSASSVALGRGACSSRARAARGGGFLQPMEELPLLPFIRSVAANKGPVEKGKLAGKTSEL